MKKLLFCILVLIFAVTFIVAPCIANEEERGITIYLLGDKLELCEKNDYSCIVFWKNFFGAPDDDKLCDIKNERVMVEKEGTEDLVCICQKYVCKNVTK